MERMSHENEHVTPQVVAAAGDAVEGVDEASVTEPGRLIRIASMTRAMLDEAREAPLDEAGRRRMLSVYHSSLTQLRDALSGELQDELAAMFEPLESEGASESELRIVQAQLVGWLEGVFSGIQASLFSQRAALAAQIQEMQHRGLEAPDTDGTYL
jgi:hypothetical protein